MSQKKSPSSFKKGASKTVATKKLTTKATKPTQLSGLRSPAASPASTGRRGRTPKNPAWDAAVKEFGRRLEQALRDRDMSQSDLARMVWGGQTRVDSRGYEAPVGRDRISAYVNGTNAPDPRTLDAIAGALGVPVSELAPGLNNVETPTWVQMDYDSKTGMAYLTLGKVLPLNVAVKITDLIWEAEGKPKPAK